MKLKTKLYAFKVLFFFLIASALLVSYVLYLNEYKKYIHRVIDREITIQSQLLAAPIITAEAKLKNKLPHLINLHKDAASYYKSDSNTDLVNLKIKLAQQYNLNKADIELFLINKNKVIYETTFEKDLGLDMSVFPNGSKLIDKAFNSAGIHMSRNVVRDPVDLKYRLYSYAKVDDENILEISFTNPAFENTLLQSLIHSHDGLSTSLYGLFKDERGYFYYPMVNKEMTKSKEAFYNSLPRFAEKDQESDWIMRAFFQKGAVTQKLGDHEIVYIPILNKSEYKAEYQDIIAKFDIDLTEHNQFLRTIGGIFIAIFLLATLGLLALSWLVKKQFTSPINLITNQIRNTQKIPLSELHNENNEFGDIATSYNALFDRLNDQIQSNKYLIGIDYLTQIKNRRAYDDAISELIEKPQKDGEFSMILFDIDDFKKVNDDYGHDVGDKVLVDLARRISEFLYEPSLFFRIGGEEFAVILPATNGEEAYQLARCMSNHVAEISYEGIYITLSMGVVAHKVDECKNSLYKRVDNLMYQAKKQGKNRIICDHR